MKPIVIVLSLFLVAVLLAACAPPVPAPTVAPPPPTATSVPPTPTVVPPTDTPAPSTDTPAPTPTLPPEVKSKMVYDSFKSAALEGNLLGTPATHRFRVHLPPSYDKGDKRYPVIYALPSWGIYGDATDFQIPDAVDRWVQAGKMPEVIIVEVDTTSKYNSGDWYQSNAVVGDWMGYITKDLVEHIDGKYRTLPQAESRALVGLQDSGGCGAHHLGFRYPGVFGVAVDMVGGLGTEPFLKECILKGYKGESHLWVNGGICQTALGYGLSAAMAPQPDKKPYFDSQLATKVNGEWQLVPDLWEKIEKIDPIYDIEAYKNQPDKLKAFLFVHGINDQMYPHEMVLDLVKAMKEAGIPVDFREVTVPDGLWGHFFWDNDMLLDFLRKQLAFE